MSIFIQCAQKIKLYFYGGDSNLQTLQLQKYLLQNLMTPFDLIFSHWSKFAKVILQYMTGCFLN
jgi:hypothetical protein